MVTFQCCDDKLDNDDLEMPMRDALWPVEGDELEEESGCAYILDEPDRARTCGAPRRATSSYCQRHHSRCYIVSGSSAEVRQLQEVEALASAVGGRRARLGAGPS